jgi:hypothetical protein
MHVCTTVLVQVNVAQLTHYKHYKKPNGQSRTDNPKALATFGTQDTVRRHA